MNKFWLSVRPYLENGRWNSPKEYVKYAFKGINFKFNLEARNNEIDGRWLYSIEFPVDYSYEQQMEFFDIINEGLSKWSSHPKSYESAKELYLKLTGVDYVD